MRGALWSMQEGTLYILVLLIASVLNLFLAVYVYCFRRGKAGSTAFIGLIMAITFYSLGFALEIMSTSLNQIIFFIKLEYIGIAFFPVLWLVLILQFTGRERWVTRPFILGLLIIPAITFLLQYTNDMHQLFYREISMMTRGAVSVAILSKGPWYWVHICYIYLAMVFGIFLLVQMGRRVAGFHRLQTYSMILGSLLPLTGDIIYLFGYSPWGLDLAPIMIGFSTPLYAWGLFNFRFLDLVPIARDKVFDGLREGVIVLDEQNRIADYNPAAAMILTGLSVYAIGRPIDAVVSLPNFIEQFSAGQSEFEMEITQEQQPSYFYARVSPLTDKSGILLGKTIVFSDMTEKILLLNQLHHLATVDETTRLYNRRQFLHLSSRAIEHSQKLNQAVAVILLDVDYFKNINDTYGHAAGDFVLLSIARRCQDNMLPAAVFGRYGGEEFTVFLEDTTPAETCRAAETLRQVIAEAPVVFENQSIAVTASFGVAVMNANQATMDLLLRQADLALYKAKAAGRNCVVAAE